MSYSKRMQQNNLYSIYLAPRGRVRMVDLGMQIAQQYLSPFDHIIGIIGEAGSGKSMLIKGMFPGLDLTNDDEGVNVRPLPLLDVYEKTFYAPHTYHVDIRFEAGMTPMIKLADAIMECVRLGRRVVVEHFEMVYPLLGRNADLLIGVGSEIIITRPSLFGPNPEDMAKIASASLPYRLMAHSAEDLCGYVMCSHNNDLYRRADVRHGFIYQFDEEPTFDVAQVEAEVKELIRQDLPISYYDDNHIKIGDDIIVDCQAPRMHVKSTGCIEAFGLHKEIIYDKKWGYYMMIGQVGKKTEALLRGLNLNKMEF